MLSHHHEYLIEYVSHLPFSLSLLALQRSNCNLNTVTYLVALQVTELMTPQRKSFILILMLRKKKRIHKVYAAVRGAGLPVEKKYELTNQKRLYEVRSKPQFCPNHQSTCLSAAGDGLMVAATLWTVFLMLDLKLLEWLQVIVLISSDQ